jgi:DNA-binding NarL/FixJ family response regulator
MEETGAVVVADMLFASKVRGVANALGVPIRGATPGGLIDVLRDSGATLVIVDLELPGGKGIDAIRSLRAQADLAGVTVIAFSSHRNAAALREGRAAGATRVLARSAFVEALPGLLGDDPGA